MLHLKEFTADEDVYDAFEEAAAIAGRDGRSRVTPEDILCGIGNENRHSRLAFHKFGIVHLHAGDAILSTAMTRLVDNRPYAWRCSEEVNDMIDVATNDLGEKSHLTMKHVILTLVHHEAFSMMEGMADLRLAIERNGWPLPEEILK